MSEAVTRRLLVVVACVGLFVLALGRSSVNGDALLYIASGRFILDHGSLPTTDPFSFASVQRPLVLHMLLPMIGFAIIDQVLGLPWLVLLSAAVASAALGALLVLCRRQSPALWLMLVPLAALCVVDRELFEVRGQAFAYTPLVMTVAAVAHMLRGGRRVAFVGLPLGLLWALLHPSFLFGAGLPVLVAAGLLFEPRARRGPAMPLLVFSVLLLLGASATPYGPALLVDVAALVRDPTTSRIEHMRSPPVTLAWAFFTAQALVLFVAHALSAPGRHRRAIGITGAVLLVMTLVSRRYAVFLVACELFAIAGIAGALAPRVAPTLAARINIGLSACMFAGSVVLARQPLPDVDRNLPVGATRALEVACTPDRVLAEFAWGGYLMYRWGAARQVFIDGRNNLYGNGVFDDYLVLVHAPERADEILDVYGIETVLWMRDWKLTAHLRGQPNRWRLVWEDDVAVVFERLSDATARRVPSQRPGSCPTP